MLSKGLSSLVTSSEVKGARATLRIRSSLVRKNWKNQKNSNFKLNLKDANSIVWRFFNIDSKNAELSKII
jgi:hypothetical protein